MATAYQERKMRDTAMNPGDQEYFDAAAAGKLMLKKCGDCGEHHHYPRSLCPFCFSDKVQWVQAKGTGEIYSYSVSRRAGPIVYCMAYVKLDEGVTMMTNIVDCDLDTVKVGQKVKVTFKKTEGGVSMPVFVPA
jgi:uncharacterized OB-fold protein